MSELADFRKAKDPYFGLAYYPENSALQFALAILELPDQEKKDPQDDHQHRRFPTLHPLANDIIPRKRTNRHADGLPGWGR